MQTLENGSKLSIISNIKHRDSKIDSILPCGNDTLDAAGDNYLAIRSTCRVQGLDNERSKAALFQNRAEGDNSDTAKQMYLSYVLPLVMMMQMYQSLLII